MQLSKYKSQIQKAYSIRIFEEKLLDLYSAGLLGGTVHTCIGQEFTGVVICENLIDGDWLFSNHRGHGHYLSFTDDYVGLFAEILGKENGCSGGIGGSQHLSNKNFYSNGIQGGMLPIGAGVSIMLKNKNKNNISVVFIGDGTFGEGILYETFNIVSKWVLPILIVVENNNISQSTSRLQNMAGKIADRAMAFGIDFFSTTINDLEDLNIVSKQAIDFCRLNNKPVILEIETFRLRSHSKGDDNRSTEYVDALNLKDVLNNLAAQNSNDFDQIKIHSKTIIENSLVVANNFSSLTIKKRDKQINENSKISYSNYKYSGKRGNEEIYNAFKDLMQGDKTIYLIGEDIETNNEFNPGQYGGAFKVTKDLSTLFPSRVKNTPISEAAITGIGIGLALSGLKSVVEIMFGDFLTLTLDQLLQHASKIKKMYGKDIDLPFLIRTPMGGFRGYGPTHSQSIEKFFLGIPSLKVIALNHKYSSYQLYKKIFSSFRSPTLVIENKSVYTREISSEVLEGYSLEITDEEIPSLKISPKSNKPDLTIVCYGGILIEVEKALSILFSEFEIVAEIIVIQQLYPLNILPIISSVKRTMNICIIEEGFNFSSLSGEIGAMLLENNATINRFIRIGNNQIIPSAQSAELELLPVANNIATIISQNLI